MLSTVKLLRDSRAVAIMQLAAPSFVRSSWTIRFYRHGYCQPQLPLDWKGLKTENASLNDSICIKQDHLKTAWMESYDLITPKNPDHRSSQVPLNFSRLHADSEKLKNCLMCGQLQRHKRQINYKEIWNGCINTTIGTHRRTTRKWV